MTPEPLKSRRLVGLFLIGCVLLNYPIISLHLRNFTGSILFGLDILHTPALR